MFKKIFFLLITFLLDNQIIYAHLTKVILSCEIQRTSCGASANYCNILCELPTTVKSDDLLEIERVAGIPTDEIKSTKSSLKIKSDRMTENLPENIGNTMANFPAFQKFSITNSKLKSIKQLDFVYMKIITELDLSSNQIEVIPNGVFDNLTQLEILAIHHNKISYLPSDTLVMLTHLKNFYAQNNRIKSVNEQFNQLTHLSIVDLRGNSDLCGCKAMTYNESQRIKTECEENKIKNDDEWKNSFLNCSMEKSLQLDTVTVGPCALNKVIRMVNEDLVYQNCIWDHEDARKLSQAEAVENCTVPKRAKEQTIWTEFEDCIAKQEKLNSQLNQLLQSCYNVKNLRTDVVNQTFNSCMMCTKMSDIRNIEKCELRYVKDNGDNVNDFLDKVLSYFGNKESDT